MQWQLIYKVYQPQPELERYHGFLPEILGKPGLLGKLADLKQLSPQQLEYLSSHGIIAPSTDHSGYCLQIPVFSREYAVGLADELQGLSHQLASTASTIIEEMRNKLESNWQKYGHVLLGQLVIDGIWHRLWVRCWDRQQTASVLAIAADAPFFTTEVIPLQEQAVLSYWQTSLIDDHLLVRQRLRHKDSVLTFRSVLKEDSTVILYGSAYANLLSLNVLFSRKVDGRPTVFLLTPHIDASTVNSLQSELHQLAVVFTGMIDTLEKKAEELYSQRPLALQAVRFSDYRYGLFTLLSYCAVQWWLEHGYLDELVQPANQRWATPVTGQH